MENDSTDHRDLLRQTEERLTDHRDLLRQTEDRLTDHRDLLRQTEDRLTDHYSVAVLKVEFAFWGRILCFYGTADLAEHNLKVIEANSASYGFGEIMVKKVRCSHLAWTGNHDKTGTSELWNLFYIQPKMTSENQR